MIKSLKLTNFRSYIDRKFEFAPGANIIVGANTAGKTNALEAILVSRLGSSFRVKDSGLINFKKDVARIESLDDGNLRAVRLNKSALPPKTFEINDHIYRRLPTDQKLPVVLFEPNQLMVLNGSPDGRRAYLDAFIGQLKPQYSTVLNKYLRTLSQRNTLLKSVRRPTGAQLFPWNVRLSQLAGQIVKARQELIEGVNQKLPDIYASLSKDKVNTVLAYAPQLPVSNYESDYLKKMEDCLEDDLRSGFTSLGPHRDDFSFMFNQHPSSSYASRGEIRTATLALKVAELNALRKTKDHQPIALLDDVYSELDNNRRGALTSHLKNYQFFITTTDADLVKKQLSKNNVIKL